MVEKMHEFILADATRTVAHQISQKSRDCNYVSYAGRVVTERMFIHVLAHSLNETSAFTDFLVFATPLHEIMCMKMLMMI
jgi:hypothetical protein